MRSCLIIAVILAGPCFAQSARDYYKELHAAGGLDRMADKYVCFDDSQDLQTFFIFGKSKDVREYMIASGAFGKLSKAYQALLKKDFLIIRGYNKGVALPDEDFF